MLQPVTILLVLAVFSLTGTSVAEYTVGNEPKDRRLLDNCKFCTLISGDAITHDGTLSKWKVNIKRKGITYFQVFRPVQGKANSFTVIAMVRLDPKTTGLHEVRPIRPTQVKKGDLIGLTYPRQSSVGFEKTSCATASKVRYSKKPAKNVAQSYDLPEINDCRKYSFQAVVNAQNGPKPKPKPKPKPRPQPQPKVTEVIILVDFTESMTTYMPKVVNFLYRFLRFTSSNSFWAKRKTFLRVVPFTDTINRAHEWKVNYANFKSAAAFRTSKRNGWTTLANKLLKQKPRSVTNLGQVMTDLRKHYKPDRSKMVILVSDFMNIKEKPSFVGVMKTLKKDGAHIFPVLLDISTKNYHLWHKAVLESTDRLGMNIAKDRGVKASVLQKFFDRVK